MRVPVQLLIVVVLGVLLAACPAATPGGTNGDGDGDGGNGQGTDGPGEPAETLVAEHGGSTGLLTFVEPGTCFWVLGNEANFTDQVEIVACDEEHEYEVFAHIEPDSGGQDWPGEETLTELARDCTDQLFEDYVGIPADESTWEILAVMPDEDEWGRGQQDIVCALFDPEAGTAEGSAQDSRE